MARDWARIPRTNSHKNGPESEADQYERIFGKPIAKTQFYTVYSTSSVPTTTVASLLTTIHNINSGSTEESSWSSFVLLVLFLSILSLLIGNQIALKSWWNNRRSLATTENEETRSAHEEVD